jgi:hypothetical protein
MGTLVRAAPTSGGGQRRGDAPREGPGVDCLRIQPDAQRRPDILRLRHVARPPRGVRLGGRLRQALSDLDAARLDHRARVLQISQFIWLGCFGHGPVSGRLVDVSVARKVLLGHFFLSVAVLPRRWLQCSSSQMRSQHPDSGPEHIRYHRWAPIRRPIHAWFLLFGGRPYGIDAKFVPITFQPQRSQPKTRRAPLEFRCSLGCGRPHYAGWTDVPFSTWF